MYTHIELWLSSVLLLLKEKRKGPTSEGDSAGNMTFKWLYALPLMPPYYLHLPMYGVFFFFFFLSLSLMLHCLHRGYEWRSHQKEKTHNRTEPDLLPLPNALCCRAVPHVHNVPNGHTAGPSGCRKWFLCIGPWDEAWLKLGKAASRSHFRGLKQERVYKIPMADCLVTVIVQKY